MKILRDYILKEIVKPFVIYLFIFIFVLATGNLIRLIELIVTKGISLLNVVRLFFWQIPSLIVYIIPMAILVALLLGLGRLSSDLEIIAMKAGGINIFRFEIPLILLGIALSLTSLVLNNEVIPQARFISRKIIKQVGMNNPLAYLEPGTFIKNFKNYILFFYGIEKDTLTNVRIYEIKEEGLPRTIIAKRGRVINLPDKKAIKLELFNGTFDESNPSDPRKIYKLNFKTYSVILKLSSEFTRENIGKKPKEMSVDELFKEKKKLLAQNINSSPIDTEIHKKISLSFACLIFVIIGFPLGILTKRKGNAVAFGLSLVVLGLYYSILFGGEALAREGIVKPEISMWMANGIFGILGLCMNLYIYRR